MLFRSYQQIGNAVPIQLAAAVAHCVADAFRGVRVRSTADLDVELMLERGVRKLRAAARNKKSKSKPLDDVIQLKLI